jgi:hypothetical protein
VHYRAATVDLDLRARLQRYSHPYAANGRTIILIIVWWRGKEKNSNPMMVEKNKNR